ncbi:MAG: hypothetical protein NW206_19820 [Hyphomonadaceae bacterium]|nr:hypothetical protein [Hyphomonadaceae bacterium]
MDGDQALAWLAANGLEPQSAEVMALMLAMAQDAQFAERAWWGLRESEHARAQSLACVERSELLGLIDTANAANGRAAQ